MNPGQTTAVVTRVAQQQWHAVDDDRVVGRGEVTRRPDGRLFLSVDAWQSAVFGQLAAAMLPALPKPLHTVVDEADTDLVDRWQRAGFTTGRREWEYLVPARPDPAPLPPGVTLETPSEAPLRALDRLLRTETDPVLGRPAEILPGPPDPANCTVAIVDGQYAALLRLAAVTRQPRIGLLAVRTSARRRGIGRALLAHVLKTLHDKGIPAASAEVTDGNVAAIALFEGAGARRTGSSVELVMR
ncbi:GNAT family N-acetyltransferase [Amycolatopsis sp. NEAU-NG30]|uniref:GNAT family N-acetyltransferase n=1 Tax=Amycolatopsis melonis TaxID=3156488 RepID=A0ABV0LPX5_9PSEU